MINSTIGLPLPAEPPPLRVDEGGAVRVGNSRISLDLIVEEYENGMTPEDMVRAYDTLALADVHAAIAYYLRHREAVQEYLKRRAAEAEKGRRSGHGLTARDVPGTTNGRFQGCTRSLVCI